MQLKLKLLALVLSTTLAAQPLLAQPQKKRSSTALPKPAPSEQLPEPPSQQDIETVKVDTNLVTVPVIASSRTGQYVADLTKEEFKISEDGTPQEIAFLATVNAPFHVLLLLDTSGSTKDKLPMIQRAASAFVDLLSSADKVKVISFDDSVRDWNDFTSDKAVIRKAIAQTTSGSNSKVYDGLERALNNLRPVSGRRAIVVFTDAVDWHSDLATYEGTLKNLDESGVIVYPIRFETRAETEAIARRQAEEQNGVGLPTSDVIRREGGATPSTFPSEDPSQPNPQGQSKSPLEMILGRPVQRPMPPQGPQGSPTDPFPDAGNRRRPPIDPGPDPIKRPPPHDSIKGMLDQAYFMADSYLKELADRSGGQVYRADNLTMLPQAFRAIAAELRTQYSLGYYPTNRDKAGKYRKIQVKTTRKDVAIRARPGYRR